MASSRMCWEECRRGSIMAYSQADPKRPNGGLGACYEVACNIIAVFFLRAAIDNRGTVGPVRRTGQRRRVKLPCPRRRHSLDRANCPGVFVHGKFGMRQWMPETYMPPRCSTGRQDRRGRTRSVPPKSPWSKVTAIPREKVNRGSRVIKVC
jgi:hypothetical protein